MIEQSDTYIEITDKRGGFTNFLHVMSTTHGFEITIDGHYFIINKQEATELAKWLTKMT